MTDNNHIPSKPTKAGALEPLSFAVALEQFLGRMPTRSREIIMARFGIGDAHPKTLEEIGRMYQITRERVRQVIASTLGFLAGEHEHPTLVKISERIQSTLEGKNGIMRTEELLDMLAPRGGKERGALLAFIECLSVIKYEKASKEYEEVYRLHDFSLHEWKKVKDAAKAIFEEANQALEEEELFARFQKKNSVVSQQKLFDFLAVAKDVCQNVFGKWGLSEWSDIRPRGTREKAHLVLKTKGVPLHFREIASLIDSYGLKNSKKRESHPQTVHNELIKDKRFVLVGRGIYALSEWGYKRGTVKEVLEEILRKATRPLSREEVLAQVLKVRQVKKSTVIINLNAFFSRIGKNAYSVKK
ncbi:MAG: HTH domain-containing protein [bacterium]|nr:HTH domain-containing protein [bacterium]